MKIGFNNWKEYLQDNLDRHIYDEEAGALQVLINPSENATNSYRLLSENKPIVCISKSPYQNSINTTFFHTMKKTSILSSESECFALNGFGKRSYAVKIIAKELFKPAKKEGKLPSFEDIIKCKSIQDITSLSPSDTMIEDKFDNHALLPPILADLLFDLENFSAKIILLKFIQKIKSIKAKSHTLNKENPNVSEEEEEWEDINNTDPNTIPIPASESPESTEDDDEIFDDIGRTFELKFGKILKFLWGTIHQEKLVTGVNLHPCSLPSTTAWLDKVHEENLEKTVNKNIKNLQNNFTSPQTSNSVTDFQNVATSISRLSNTLENHHEHELKIKKEKDKKKDEKNFDNLSIAQQNTLLLITTTENQTDEDLEELTLTPNMRSCLEQTSSIKVQAQLQYEFSSRKKFVCSLSSAMCASIKQGALASQPSHIEINGLTPFCTPNENKDDKLDQATILYMSEQMSLGKVSTEDVKRITKLSITFPTDFNSYKHYVKNFQLLLTLLSGPDSIVTNAIGTMVHHADENERTYIVHGEDEWCFFASVLDHIHRRTQQFIHSAGEGKISNLKVRQLDFSTLMDEIEGFTFTYRIPKWLKTRKRSIDEIASPCTTSGVSNNSNRRPTNNGTNNNTPRNQQTNSKKGEKVINNNVLDYLKIPSHLKYGDVFHPEMRKNIQTINHNDGTEKCNNWHHRGFCYSKCKWKSSHNKVLTQDEGNKCKDFVQKLIKKYERSRNGEN